MSSTSSLARRFAPGSSRSGVVLGLLIATFALVAALAWQAIAAMRARSEITEQVLHDYADLAVAGYVARITAELEYYAFEPGLQPLGASPTSPLPTPAPTEIWTDPTTRLSIDLVRSYFRLPLDGAALSVAGGPLPPDAMIAIADTLRGAVAIAERQSWKNGLVLLAAADGPRALVYQPVRGPAGRTTAVSGFDASFEGLRVYFDYSFTVRPLLPAMLTRGAAQDSLVSIELLAAAGPRIYRSPWVHRSRWQATRSLGPRFGDLTARATLAPDAVARVIAPGPPVAQAPLLLALCAVCLALIVASIHQIRRESELQRLRSDFVLGVSHELRTPLAQIRLFAETLRLGRVRDEAERERSLAIVDQEAARLAHLVENILVFSRAERRVLGIAPEPVALGPLVREIASGFAPLAEARGMRLETEVDDTGLWAHADRDAVRQMLLNLLDNAVKYGPEGQTIGLLARARDHAIELVVEDQGPGIAPADRARVWDRFVRLPSSGGERVAGAGIGLSVVRELVALHRGTVRIEEGARGGARVVLHLPRAEGNGAPQMEGDATRATASDGDRGR